MSDKRETTQAFDQVFFHKDQIKVGTTIVCAGRLQHGTRWRVVEIITEVKNKNGKWVRQSSPTVQKMTDEITLARVGSNKDQRAGTFGYLSYSAIWRLPDGR